MISLYTIENQITGAIYFGQSNNFQSRKIGHLRDLRGGRHRNSYLQRSFDKHKEHAFKIEPLEEHSTRELCNESEKFHISYLKFLGANVYNVRSGGDVGSTFPIETRIRWSQIRKGKKPSIESRLKHSLTLKNRTEEEKRRFAEKISKRFKGRKFSLEHRHNLSLALKGRIPSKACFNAASQERKLNPRHHSAATRAKMSASAKLRCRKKLSLSDTPPELIVNRHLDCIGINGGCKIATESCDHSSTQ